MNEKLNELLKDEAVVKELLQQETAEDAQKFLASKGVEISIEDLEKIQKALAAQDEGEEMDDSQLENVAGGASLNVQVYNPVLPGGIVNFPNLRPFPDNKYRRRW
ncbi:MAG: hypothetical protein IJT73_03870 [Selenomonadaceae bacterium]|nr:hypothetical protein [Selenomonadaceae bacterium]